MASPRWRFLVTAGGTSERIDSVRCITNSATGRLGGLVADRLAEDPQTERIFFICGKTSVCPASPKVEVLPVTGAAELEAAVRRVLAARKVDAIIHSMAVSDYRVKTVTTRELWKSGAAESGLERGGKLPSGKEDLILVLEPTVKIISLFQDLAPQALLVGFKLLDGVPHAALIEAAHELLIKNRCAWVLANDAREVSDTRHTGYLVDAAKSEEKYEGKPAIARAIAGRVLDRLKRSRS
jgi:phosphopantothenate-cysteine ligase